MPFTLDHLIVLLLVLAIILTTWLGGMLFGAWEERRNWTRRWRR